MARKLILAALSLALAGLATAGLAQDTKRAITNVAGDVYRFQNNFHFSLVVITGEGVVVSDPINAEAAAWLEVELAKMTDQPVTHLIYSHSHGDHASGGAIFADTATVIAHANAPEAIDGVTPDIRFETTQVLKLGGKTLELTYLGAGHGDDMIATVVRPENVAFIVDVVTPRRVPYRDFPRTDIDGLIAQIKAVEALDFEILAPGHGGLGTKADATQARLYVETMKAEVLAGLKAGKSVEQLADEVRMADYAGWGAYENWRPLNVEGMARWLQASGQVE